VARILLVDDEPDIRVLTRMMLEKGGHSVIEAEDDKEGLRLLEKEKPDLILLDVMMPGIKGWKTCLKIKADKNTRHIPVIMFTIRTSEDSVKKSYECGADAHINKPFDMEELLETVGRVLKKEESL
jgi:two-component system phosphate regulon response regulator PhoB